MIVRKFIRKFIRAANGGAGTCLHCSRTSFGGFNDSWNGDFPFPSTQPENSWNENGTYAKNELIQFACGFVTEEIWCGVSVAGRECVVRVFGQIRTNRKDHNYVFRSGDLWNASFYSIRKATFLATGAKCRWTLFCKRFHEYSSFILHSMIN